MVPMQMGTIFTARTRLKHSCVYGDTRQCRLSILSTIIIKNNKEAEHKGWCDTELSTNEQTRKEKTEAVETLHAEIDQLEASIAKLTEDISELTKAIPKTKGEKTTTSHNKKLKQIIDRHSK